MDENSSNKSLESRIRVKGDCPKCKKHTILEKTDKEIDLILNKDDEDPLYNEHYLCTQCYSIVSSEEIKDYYNFQVNGKYKLKKEKIKKDEDFYSRKKIKEKLNRETLIFP